MASFPALAATLTLQKLAHEEALKDTDVGLNEITVFAGVAGVAQVVHKILRTAHQCFSSAFLAKDAAVVELMGHFGPWKDGVTEVIDDS